MLLIFGEKIKEVSELGVRALGGCCGTTPEYIGEIYRTLFQAEHTLKSSDKNRVDRCSRENTETTRTAGAYKKVQKERIRR